MELVIPAMYKGQRIDKALSDYFSLSRNFFQQLFERKLITIAKDDNKQVIKKSYTLEWDETIYLPELERYHDNQILAEAPNIHLDIKHQTADYLIVYKPKGVLSHPKTLFDVSTPSVSGFLYHMFWNIPSLGGFVRAGIVHRLDKDTDGLMIVATSEKGLQHFKMLFDTKAKDALQWVSTSGLHKYYRAKCQVSKQGEQRLKLHYQKTDDKPFVLQSLVYPKVPTVWYPKMGVTHIMGIQDIQEWWKKQVFVDLELLTGRTHQIRYQLSSIWLPIIWDFLYNPSYVVGDHDLQLAAYGLDFVDPEGKDISIRL